MTKIRRMLNGAATWLMRLKAAQRYKELTAEERVHLSDKSRSWRTCGVGEFRASLKKAGFRFDRDFAPKTDSPRDTELYELGCRFHSEVCAGSYEDAEGTYHEIEALAKPKAPKKARRA